MKIKILSVFLILLSLCTIGQTAFAVEMYAPDGRTVNVAETDVAAWKSVGWYDYPVTIMYAFDGRTVVVALSDVTAWQNVGWFASKEDVYRHVATLAIGNGYEPLWYSRPQYSCLDMGTYYLCIDWPTYGANGETWSKVYKATGSVEEIWCGSDMTDFAFGNYIYANYDLPVYWY